MKQYRNGTLVACIGPEMSELPKGAPGVFETLLVRDRQPVFWSQHWTRFEAGAAGHGFAPPLTSAALRIAADTLIEENRIRGGVLRYAAWRERGGAVTWQLEVSGPRPVMRKTGLHITWGPRLDVAGPDRAFKHLRREAWTAAVREARAKGFDEALLTDSHDELVEAGTANIFVVRQGTLVTPPLTAGPLPGVVRAQLIALAKLAGVTVAERRIARNEIELADEAWLTNSLIGVRPVLAIDGRPFGGERPMLERLRAAWALRHGWDPTTPVD